MCGRLVVARPRDVFADLVGAQSVPAPELPLSWNVPPSAEVYALVATTSGRRLGSLVWGLVPWWSPSPTPRRRPINARAETMARNRTFADSLVRRRCLVIADGFYEWERAADGTRQPWYFARPDGAPMALAALWDRWRPGPDHDAAAAPLTTGAIVTTAATDDMGGIHDRMPAMLDPDDWDRWLDPASGNGAALSALVAPGPTGRLVRHRANRRANNVANDGPELLSA